MKGWLHRLRALAEPLWGRLLESELLHRGLAGWQELSPRDRRALAWLVTALTAAVVIFGLWRPLLNYSDQARSRHAQAQEDLAWMQSQRPLGTDSRQQRELLDEPSLISHARQHRLHPDASQSLGEGAWSLRLTDADFEAVLNWLAALLQEGLSIDEFHARRGASAGTIDLQLVIRKR